MVDLKLNFLAINVADFQQSYSFYTETLGIRATGVQPEWEGFAQPGMTWEDHFGAEAKAHDIHRAVAWLKDNQATIVRDMAHHPDWKGTDIYIADPEGNRVQVVQYGEL